MLAHEDHFRTDLLEQAREFRAAVIHLLSTAFFLKGLDSFPNRTLSSWENVQRGGTHNENLPALRAQCFFVFNWSSSKLGINGLDSFPNRTLSSWENVQKGGTHNENLPALRAKCVFCFQLELE
jgi:hypothetical protein